MVHSDELLRAYSRLVMRLSGAGSISLFLPAAAPDTRSILVHEGRGAPAPELADTAAGEDLSLSFRAERSDPAAPPLFQAGSADEDCRLIRVLLDQALLAASDAEDGKPVPRGTRRRSREAGRFVWIGLRFDPGESPFPNTVGPLRVPFTVGEGEAGEWWNRIFGLAANLAGYTERVSRILHDPVTGLPGRAELQAELQQAMLGARETDQPLTLLLVNPDDFGPVNERFGRESGDEVIRDVASRLRTTLRRTDHVGKFGGAIFSAVLVDTPLAGATLAAGKLLRGLSEGAFLDGAVRLGFSIGAAAFDPGQEDLDGPLDLIWRADQALNAAKRAGGSQIRVWKEGSEIEQAGNLDRLTGIFTGNMAKDYRNMTLLWDSVNVVAEGLDTDDLATRMLERLHSVLRPKRVAIFWRAGNGELSLLRAAGSNTAEPAEQEYELMGRACAQRRPLLEVLPALQTEGSSDGPRVSVAVPLGAAELPLGCLYLDDDEDSLRLDSSDLAFLEALASQMAVALDRAQLAERDRRNREREHDRLCGELDELRQAVQRSKLTYCSKQLDELLATARRIAPTDATVLITGESGTGKELLAGTIHELSPRRKKPMVIVDCGAIAATLIDSELFGHEKGAFTGALERKIGRLAEADGATVLLDEIGELPLEVQTKLLRFVQERQVTPVGSSKPRVVDVRILAATNVDLAKRVAEGKFREDLYHRLNVVRLHAPALRQRPEDILHLARHFVQKYAATYRKPVRGPSPEAETLLAGHDWPGNVRELQNRIMQAVLLCDGGELGPADFGKLSSSGHGTPSAAGLSRPLPAGSGNADDPAGSPVRIEPQPAPGAPDDGDPAALLRLALAREIESAVGGETRVAVPLGKWLGDDLILAADALAGGVARRGAEIVGIPATTYRRRLRQAASRQTAGLSPRPNTWSGVRDALAGLVRADKHAGENLLETTQRILLDEIVARFPDDARIAAALLGVSEPTLARRLA